MGAEIAGIAGLIVLISSLPHYLATLKVEKSYQRQMRCMAVYIYYCISAGSWYGFSLSCRRAYEVGEPMKPCIPAKMAKI